MVALQQPPSADPVWVSAFSIELRKRKNKSMCGNLIRVIVRQWGCFCEVRLIIGPVIRNDPLSGASCAAKRLVLFVFTLREELVESNRADVGCLNASWVKTSSSLKA
jgi:hypothetical protein